MSDLGNKEVIAQNIKYFMELHGKTRKEMCEAIGVKYSTFSDWVNANKYPRIDRIEMMAKQLCQPGLCPIYGRCNS